MLNFGWAEEWTEVGYTGGFTWEVCPVGSRGTGEPRACCLGMTGEMGRDWWHRWERADEREQRPWGRWKGSKFRRKSVKVFVYIFRPCHSMWGSQLPEQGCDPCPDWQHRVSATGPPEVPRVQVLMQENSRLLDKSFQFSRSPFSSFYERERSLKDVTSQLSNSVEQNSYIPWR